MLRIHHQRNLTAQKLNTINKKPNSAPSTHPTSTAMANFTRCFFVLLSFLMSPCHCQQNFSAVLVFGDSTVDAGNNNYIMTLIKADHIPYGVNYPNHVPTGRFSDGRLVPDMLASKLGIKPLVPPFLQPNLPHHEIRTGVNFAFSGAGLDELTSVVSAAMPVLEQTHMLGRYVYMLRSIVGVREARSIMNKSLILISVGINDLICNWYDFKLRRIEYDNISEYADFLLQRLQEVIQNIYHLGGRRFAVGGIGPVGCIPFQITIKFTKPLDRHCIEEQNAGAIAYNNKLKKMLKDMQPSLPGSKLVYANYYDTILDMSKHPKKYGFSETKRGCCGTGLVEAGPLCNLLTPVCLNPSEYMFWDSFHPSEAAYEVVAREILANTISQL